MSVNHYENFPVGSVLLPKTLRKPIAVIYHFARTADDIADEGNALPSERLAQLAEYRRALMALEWEGTSTQPLFQSLGKVIAQYKLSLIPFQDLLSAFEQDVQKTRYADFQELMDYCHRSANPVGRLVLALTGQDSVRNLKHSDHICSALQLINFWQDIALDWDKGRVYLPANELALFDVTENDLADFATGKPCSVRWSELMHFQVKRARQLMRAGAPLVDVLPGRLGWEIQLTVMGGLRILEKIDQCQGDVFRHRPVLTWQDWLVMLWKLLRSRVRKDRRWLR